ncbi:MAG: hypothetical protein WBA16_04990 [Nonlabens sp.]
MNREELIQAYVHGTLKDADVADLKRQMELDKSLLADMREYENIQKAIREADRQMLKKRLQAAEDLGEEQSTAGSEQTTAIKQLRPYLLPLAAACIIGIVLMSKNFYFSSPNDSSVLYDQYYTTYPNTLLPVTRSNDVESKNMEAFVAYEANEFEKAAGLFKEYLNLEEDPDVEFYYAMSLINSGNEDKALPLLNELHEATTVYLPQAYWYAALIELKNEKTKNAQALIDSLLHLDVEFKYKEAVQLKKDLNEANR